MSQNKTEIKIRYFVVVSTMHLDNAHFQGQLVIH